MENVLIMKHESLDLDAATEEFGRVGDTVPLLRRLVILGGLGKNISQNPNPPDVYNIVFAEKSHVPCHS